MGTVIKLVNKLAAKHKHDAVVRVASKLMQESRNRLESEVLARADKADSLLDVLDKEYMYGAISHSEYKRMEKKLVGIRNKCYHMLARLSVAS